MENLNIYVPRLLDPKEYFSEGHRACQGCGETIALRQILKALGKNVVVANATGCSEIISSPFPQTAWRVPWIHVAFENAAAVASGVEAGLKALMRKGRIPQRRICVIAVAGDGGTADIGFQALSGAMERGHDMIYVCLDNEAYMNTGIQRSSSTPYGAMTTTSPPGRQSKGQATWKKNLPEIMAAHDIPYVATASPSYPFDLIRKVKRAAEIQGPAYLQILAVCPTGWRAPSEETIRLGRMAAECGLFPIYEVDHGKYMINVDPGVLQSPREYLKLQGRFRHLTEEDIAYIERRTRENFDRLRAKCGLTAEYAVPEPEDPDKPRGECILCGLCVRACGRIVGASALGLEKQEGTRRKTLTFEKTSPSCIGCGSCAYICPTRFLQIEDRNSRRILSKQTPKTTLKEFELLPCEQCGRPFLPKEQLEYVQKKFNLSRKVALTCFSCGGKRL